LSHNTIYKFGVSWKASKGTYSIDFISVYVDNLEAP